MIIQKVGPERLLSYRAIVFLAAVFLAIAIGILTEHSQRAPIESKAEDAIVRMAPRAARADVVIVAMDDASVTKYGPIKSWPRSLLAQGLSKIESGGAKVAVVDLALDKRTQTGDSELWRTMANNRNVVLGMSYDANRPQTYTPDDIRSLVFLEKYAIADKLTLDKRNQVFPYQMFEPPVSDFTGSSRGVGVFVRETEPDDVLRSARLFYRSTVTYPPATAAIRGKFPTSKLADGAPVALPNLSLVTALRIYDLDKDFVQVASGNTVKFIGSINPPVAAPIDDQGRMMIRYYGPPGHYITYSFADLMSDKIKPEVFKGKVVFLGATAAGDPATDARATPFPGLMPRVEVTANAVSTFMDRSFFSRNEHRIVPILIMLGLVTGAALMFFSGVRSLVITLVLLVAWFALSYALYAFNHVMLPILPGVAAILAAYVISMLLFLGPMRPVALEAPPMYVPPPSDKVHTA
ncbi:MAG: serine/threonine protein kinase with Chase2 sensor [Capsulimonas sp.]|jgi:CHASE2 domain-containing sensor protein|nr:serine/threonine protein kinase with Chase2 sensor [Capsulimonas sp.]